MDTQVIIDDSKGTPWGSYDVEYFDTHGRAQGSDSGVSEAYVREAALDLRPDEVMVATCRSQPGGLTAYGSERAKRLFSGEES